MRSFLYALCVLLGTAAAVHGEKGPKREIYAHYMGCFPAGAKAIASHYREQAKELDPNNATSMITMQGGRISNWPLVPQEWMFGKDDLRRAVELDIQRALRIGIDGFAVDAWAGGDDARTVFELMLQICREMQLPFTITLCLDPSCHAVKTSRYEDTDGGHIQGMLDTVRYLLANFQDHPNLARRDGKPLIFTYQTRSFLSPEQRLVGNGRNETQRWRNFLLMLDTLRRMAREEFHTELFVHFDLDYAFGGIDYKQLPGSRPPHEPGPIVADLAAYLASGDGALQGFNAIGGFMGSNWEREYELVAGRVAAAGGQWASPIWHQYNNKQGAMHVEPGTDKLRRMWDQVRATKSTLLQYVTWNDYGEDTVLAPSTDTRYTLYDLTGYQIAWWKTGQPPVVDHDRLYLIYRHYPANASIFPFNAKRSAPGVLEVTTLLTSPATVTLPNRSETYQAPAGLFTRQFPLTPGPVTAQIIRDQHVTLELQSPEPISDKPWREANGMTCYSSEFDAQWARDFPGIKPQTFAEYGDEDGDGLPNWFEMLWFGRFGDYQTATAADPQADPDGDGLTNLQEYQHQSHPLKSAVPYQPGFIWDLETVHKTGVSFNPDPDSSGRRIWRYLYKVGENPVPLDGDYQPTPVAAGKVPYAGEMSHHMPAENPQYKSAYGWIARLRNPLDNSWMIQLRPGLNSAAILAWESPVLGVVSLDLATAARPEKIGSRATLTIQHSTGLQVLKQVEIKGDQCTEVGLPSIEVRPGDRLYVIGSGQNQDIVISTLKIQLQRMK